jgi:transcriptional regulator with PAS, ATPase and Fis domain
MPAKVLITAPYVEFGIVAKEIAADIGIDIVVINEVLEKAVAQSVLISEERSIDVIISRGGTAHSIEKAMDIPVIKAEANDFDILTTLCEAKRHFSKIGFVGFSYPTGSFDFKFLTDIIGIDVKKYLFKDSNDIDNQIKKARADKMEAIATGGIYTVNLAQANGMKGFLIKASTRTIAQALQRAKDLINIREKDRKYSELIKKILDLSHDGILVLDNNNKIKFINHEAKEILDIKKDNVINKFIFNISNLNVETIEFIFKHKYATKDEIVTIKNVQLLMNRDLIKVEDTKNEKVITFQKVARLQQLEQNLRLQLHKRGLIAKYNFGDIIACSKIMNSCIEKAKKFAYTDSTILITGETGTGKELFAQSIHNSSKRRRKPFVAINCAALPDDLLESELFGFDEGSFTGARKGGKQGLFELAHGGTIFLDEIGALSKNFQTRLLRVLQEREIFHIGGDRIIPVDVRVIVATNENLEYKVMNNSFRSDLYYRLNILNLQIPPLRDRLEDIPLLVDHFLKMVSPKLGKKISNVDDCFIEGLYNYYWPGNIRELYNLIEKVVILSDSEFINSEHISLLNNNLLEEESNEPPRATNENILRVRAGSLAEMESQLIKQVYHQLDEKKTATARVLKISRATLWNKLKMIKMK